MDRHLWYYRFKADVDWLDSFIDDIERTDRDLIIALTDATGVGSGFNVTERAAGQNFSVDISSGVAYDPSGKRIYSSDTQNLPFVEDEDGNPITVAGSGNARIVSIYAVYALVDEPSSSVVDGFGDTVYTIQTESVSFKLYQGTTATSGSEVALADPGGDMVRLADVTIRYSDSTIANADIDEDVKEYLTLTLAADEVGFDEIDWGTGANQVDGTETTHWIISKTATNELTLAHASLTAGRTWTFPDASSTVLGTDNTANVTNKTYLSLVATGNATFDTNTLFVDATNNRVYVGATSSISTAQLNVHGASGVAISVSNTSDSNRGGALAATGSGGSGTCFLTSSSSGYTLTFGIDSVEWGRIHTDGRFFVGGGSATAVAWGQPDQLQMIDDYEGGTVGLASINTNNNHLSSAARVLIQTAGALGGDPYLSLDISGVTSWYILADNSDSDSLKILNDSTTNLVMLRSGNTGIGGTPTDRFAVFTGTGYGVSVLNTDDTNRGGALHSTGAAGSGSLTLYTNHSGYALVFGVNNTEYARVGTDGNFVISTSGTSLGGTLLLQAYKSSSGADVGAILKNTSNTASSSATFNISVGGSSAADPGLFLDISGIRTWYVACDNSASDAFVIGLTTVGSGDLFKISTGGDSTFISTSADASAGPVVTLDRNSASPAASDFIGKVSFTGRDSGANSTEYGFIAGNIVDPTNGSEDGAIYVRTLLAGSNTGFIIAGNTITLDAATTITGASVTFGSEPILPTQDPPVSMASINKQSTIKVYGSMAVSGASAGAASGYNIDGISVSSYDATITIDRDLTDGIVVATPDATSYPYLIVGSPGTTTFGLRAFVTTTGVEVVGAWTSEFILAGI